MKKADAQKIVKLLCAEQRIQSRNECVDQAVQPFIDDHLQRYEKNLLEALSNPELFLAGDRLLRKIRP